MEINICRESVCMGDDADDHTIPYVISETTRFSDIFQELIRKKYFPSVSGNDVVWTLFCENDDLISWKTEENQLYSRFVSEEPAIMSMRRWTAEPAIMFKYYSPPIKRARQIFEKFGGQKFHIWHEGFMPEYESYHITQAVETEWLYRDL